MFEGTLFGSPSDHNLTGLQVSITFDPFMYLTLPLPIQKMWQHAIYYVPWDMHKPHVKVRGVLILFNVVFIME